VRIQTETYGFARQKTRGGSRNPILISDMSFLVDFRPEKASGRGHKNNEGILLVIQFPRNTVTVTALDSRDFWTFNDSIGEPLFSVCGG
jgi:hypothetical protein